MKLSHSLLLFVISLSFAAAASGNDLNYLAGTADAVVVGSINTRLEDSNRVSFSISVERVIKGDANMKVAHVLHPWKRLGIELSSRGSNKPIDAPVYGMWFLQRAGPSEWDVIPANGRDGMLFNLYLPAAQVLPQRYTTKLATSVIDSIVVEFAAGAEAERNRLRTAVELLKTIQTPAIGTVTDAYVTSSTPGFQIAGITLALAHNNPDSLSALVRVWPGIRQDLAREYIVTSLRDSFRDVSPAAVTQLAAIIDDGSLPELRSAGIRAIAAIHTKESLPMLARLLQGDNAEERMRAVFGISAFANGCPVQTPDNVVTLEYLQFKNPAPYRTPETISHFAFRRGPAEQESELSAFWLKWWNMNQSELTK